MTDFSKIGKSNRNRGASYERKIAKILTNSLGVKFRRSPRSGALLRDGAVNGAFIGGDLVCEKDFKFSIECKNCKDPNLEAIIKNPTTAPLVKYWCQCLYDAKASSTEQKIKYPLLFFNMKSVRKDYVCMKKCDVETMLKNYPKMSMIVSKINGPVKIDIDNTEVEMKDISETMVFLMDDFLDLIIDDVFY